LCNDVCDCCIEGRCAKWSEYQCFIFKTFELIAGLFFLLSSFNFLVLGIIHDHFLGLKRKFNKHYFRVKQSKEIKNDILNKITGKKELKKKKSQLINRYYDFKHMFFIEQPFELKNLIKNDSKKEAVI